MHRPALGIIALSLLSLLFVACVEPPPSPAPLTTTSAEQPILNGIAPDRDDYNAVVGIHSLGFSGPSAYPFCSGTLIANSSAGSGGDGAVILTAGHCMYHTGASQVAVYLGCDAAGSGDTPDIANGCPPEGFFAVSEVQVHPNYDNRRLLNDIALLRLASPIPSCSDAGPGQPCADAVPTLPANWFDDSKIGTEPLNFAGFGDYDLAGHYGIKLQLGDIPCLAGSNTCFTVHSYGCRAFGCRSRESDEATMVSYLQSAPPEPGKGPCFGDSGGPMFVEEGGQLFTAGVTSFGDSNCTEWGTSTRTDAFADWIAGFIGVATCGDGACTGDEDCAACEADCGVCPFCGDGTCGRGEDCASCETDCGACPYCGDGACDSDESCGSCEADCGACPACGDGTCDSGESCATCEADCGACPTCGGNHAACSSSSDCCSGNCKRGICRGN